MLKNYGYKVVDLGKDVPLDKIIAAAKEEHADIIGLSALMTTTMMRMKDAVEYVRANNLPYKSSSEVPLYRRILQMRRGRRLL